MKFAKNRICAMVAIAGLFLFSCKQKDNELSLFGKWQFVSFEYDSSGSLYQRLAPQERDSQLAKMNDVGKAFVFYFKKDSTYTVTSGTGEKMKTVNGTFKTTGPNELLMSPDNNSPQTARIILLDKSKIIMNEPGQGLILTLKKIQ